MCLLATTFETETLKGQSNPLKTP